MVSTRTIAPTTSASRRIRSGGARRADAHGVAHVGKRLARHRAGLLGALGEDLLEALLVAAQVLVALTHGREHLDDRLGRGGLEVAVAARGAHVVLDRLGRRAARDREYVDEVRDPGLVGRA